MTLLKLRSIRPLALILSLGLAFLFGVNESYRVTKAVYQEHIVPVANNFIQVKQTRDPELAEKQIEFAYNDYAKRYFPTHAMAVMASNYALPLESARVFRHSLNTLPPTERAELTLLLVQNLREGKVSEPVFRNLYRLNDKQFDAMQQCYDEGVPETDSETDASDLALEEMKFMSRIRNGRGACWTFFDLMPMRA